MHKVNNLSKWKADGFSFFFSLTLQRTFVFRLSFFFFPFFSLLFEVFQKFSVLSRREFDFVKAQNSNYLYRYVSDLECAYYTCMRTRISIIITFARTECDLNTNDSDFFFMKCFFVGFLFCCCFVDTYPPLKYALHLLW